MRLSGCERPGRYILPETVLCTSAAVLHATGQSRATYAEFFTLEQCIKFTEQGKMAEVEVEVEAETRS